MESPWGRRRNMAERTAEDWRPPLFTPGATPQQRRVAALRRFFDLQAGSIWNDLTAELGTAQGTVLDVGCGAQPYRGLLPTGVVYRGIDTADAADHFGYEMPDTLYFEGDVWPIDTNSVDLVLCTETLEHVPDPPLFLAEASRCLRPGGTLLLTVPFAARWHFIPYDYWRFTPSSLKRLLTAAGFDQVAVYARGNALTVACYKVMALILPLLMPQARQPMAAWAVRVPGLLLLPVLLLCAVVANFSLQGAGGDDCLGYTARATRAQSEVGEGNGATPSRETP